VDEALRHEEGRVLRVGPQGGGDVVLRVGRPVQRQVSRRLVVVEPLAVDAGLVLALWVVGVFRGGPVHGR
jgi:hypothetical protein